MFTALAKAFYNWWVNPSTAEANQNNEESDQSENHRNGGPYSEHIESPKRDSVKCKVTAINKIEDYALLDEDIYLDLGKLPRGVELKVGDEVVADLHLKGDVWHVSSMQILDEDWEAPPQPNKLVGKIIRISKDSITLQASQGTTNYEISSIDKELRFSRGDWVNVHLENGKIAKMEPLRKMTVTGFISSMRQYDGAINDEIWFSTRQVCINGYRPFVGDEVLCEAIESDQGALTWRATSLILKTPGSLNLQSRHNRSFSLALTKAHKQLLESKENINITLNLNFNKMKVNESKAISIVISNQGKSPQELRAIEQDSPLVPDHFVVQPSFPTYPKTLEPDTKISVDIICNARKLGQHQQLFIFDFGRFKMGRFAKVEIEDPELDFFKGSPYQRSIVSLEMLNLSSKVKSVMKGQLPILSKGRNTQSNYVKMGLYPIPPKLWAAFLEKEDLWKVSPVLAEPLNPKNYASKFSLLLHLEEIQMMVNMQQYNMREVCLQRRGQFLNLEVPGLSEGRPSLLIGDKALLTDPSIAEFEEMVVYEGYIAEVHKDSVNLVFKDEFQSSYNGMSYNVTFEFNRGPIRKCHYAVNFVKQFQAVLFPPLSTELGYPLFRCHEWFNSGLNARQKQAVTRIIEARGFPSPYVIFGPPGTGKTITLVEAILQIFHTMEHSRILACAPSNSAADLIAIKLIRTGKFDENDLVRLNAFQRKEESVPEELEKYSQNGDNLSIVAHHRIIVSTCSMAGILHRLEVRDGHFTHILIDEAGQATEPEALIPITLAPNSKVILVGDHLQLGPIVMSKVASSCGLQTSLLERIMNRRYYQPNPTRYAEDGNYDPYLVTKLINNYRSVPELIELPSKMFYNSELLCCCPSSDNPLAHSRIFPTKGFPIVFHGILGEELRESDSPSWFNPAEVLQVVNYLSDLYDEKLTSDEVGIITPYRKQVEKIRLYMNRTGIDPCKVGSVEEFQGQERRAIIVSMVRTLTQDVPYEANIGFLSQPKRFNVTITRAKEGLIVVGDPLLLTKDENWGAFLKHIIEKGGYRGCQFTSRREDAGEDEEE